MDAAQKMTFLSFFFKKKTNKKKVQKKEYGSCVLWSFMLAPTVVSCDGVLCVKEVGASVQQWRLYKPLADLILIYEFLFPMTYSIFISYIYLFWEYIFAAMRLNKQKKKSRKRHSGFSSFTVLILRTLHLHASLGPFKGLVGPVYF